MTTPVRFTERSLTTRSVLYVGYPCNIRCQFCYYAHAPDRRWRSLEALCRDARLFREKFGHDQVDITGGEPTIHPRILDLVKYCRDIHLRPSLITNAQVLSDRDLVRKFQDHGIHDFLCSVHAIGDMYNQIVCRKQGWANLEKAIDNLNDAGIGWRANCTVTRHVGPQLEDVVNFTAERGCLVMNFISFNPFYEWEHEGANVPLSFQARHSEVRDTLHAALDACDQHGMEANVRYMPFCNLKGHEEKCYNFHQMPYDPREWSYDTWCFSERGMYRPWVRFFWQWGVGTVMRSVGRLLGPAQSTRLWAWKNRYFLYKKGEACRRCSLRSICDGFTRQYANRFGYEEAEPFTGQAITDPLHFISHQEKIVD